MNTEQKKCPMCGEEMEQGALLNEYGYVEAIDLFCPNCEYQTEWEPIKHQFKPKFL